ncbi:hypothetical protein IPV69_17120 [Humisphaera borealis]|uniref:MFS transporter n=2 Tax=Humisphaera borealis TaxID=2807512 RepID=A0A7M2WTW9_9BACT|nr:MFS transporter [Humisphaera borealis]QOV87980.1 hypothetical protein IPV69_17120 [Humisphaera borealis]
MFTIGIVFYTKDRFGWGLTENFRLAAAQGVVYVMGALSAHALTSRLSHRVATIALHSAMALACLAGVLAADRSAVAAVVAVLFAYTFFSAVAWPILESLVSVGTTGPTLARRLGVYNVVWPAVGAVVLAISGTVIERLPIGVFLVPAIAHLVCIGLAWMARTSSKGVPTATHAADDQSQHAPHAALLPSPELMRVRTVALWVSRLGLPATYAVIYGLMPLLPSLPAMERLDTSTQTFVSSAWPAARWLAFVALAAGTWWHTRPRVMVAAAVAMGIAFLGCALPPSQFLGTAISPTADMAALLLWQVVLGASLGVIYSGSLYFGMVLSEGSTEHSGYHEALIGLGWILGPGAGVLMQVLAPDNRGLAVVAVGSVIGLSVIAVVAASVIAGRTDRRGTHTKTLANTAQT